MEAVHVLDRLDRPDHLALVDLLRQRQLHEDSGDTFVRVQLPDERQELFLQGLLGKNMVEGLDSDLPAGLLLPQHVHRRGGVLAHEHRGQSDRTAQFAQHTLQFAANPLVEGLSIHEHGHGGDTLASRVRMEPEPLTQVGDAPAEDRSALAGVLRYYELAKRAEWQVRDLPWNELPPVPQYKGSPQKIARRNDMWRSVITQQLQADELAVEMATQLFRMAPDRRGRLTSRRWSRTRRAKRRPGF